MKVAATILAVALAILLTPLFIAAIMGYIAVQSLLGLANA